MFTGGYAASKAALGAHSAGIFTGPDSVGDKVVQFGDVIPRGLEVQGLNLSPESLNDLGQIAFVAVGYRFEITTAGASSFASVLVPAPLPNGDSVFEVSFAGQTAPLYAGVAFDFTAAAAGGVSEFTITGSDESEAIDPNNPLAFVTGVTFTGAFEGVVVMTPLTEESDDTAAPVLQLPSDITILATSASGAVVTYSATATDDTDPNPTVDCIRRREAHSRLAPPSLSARQRIRPATPQLAASTSPCCPSQVISSRASSVLSTTRLP